MILPIGQILPPELLQRCQAMAQREELFVDGKTTAGWYARRVKHNQQARPDHAVQSLLDDISTVLLGHELVQAAARPKTLVRLLLSRYQPGMAYGEHVDDALMDRQRTDLSLTLFLTPPASYEGGELIINDASADRAFKLDAGDMLLYPSTTLHQVAPVTRGQRLVIVGWIRSYIRDAARRELLFDLERSIAALRSDPAQQPTLALLLKSRSNLLRMWVED